MKTITKFLFVSAVAVTVIAISAAPSEAAKKKAKAAAPCSPGMLCTAPAPGVSKIMACGGDGKWYQAIFTPWCMTGTICPPACS